jgi:type III secretion protein J
MTPGRAPAPNAKGMDMMFTLIKRRLLPLVLLACLGACVSEVPLQTGLAETDANEMLTLLKRHGIAASKARAKDGVALSVREGQLARAAELLRSAGLPKRQLSDLGRVFKKEGMISTPLEERARYLHGLSQELEYTLSQIDGVVMARVHIVLPERVAPGEPIQPSSASVFLKHQGPFDEDLILPRVRRLVTTSIPGLVDESGNRKLSVVMVPAQSIESPQVEWQQVGPFMVEAGSADQLKTWAFACLAAILALGGLVVFLGIHFLFALNKKRLLARALKQQKNTEAAIRRMQEEEKARKRSSPSRRETVEESPPTGTPPDSILGAA